MKYLLISILFIFNNSLAIPTPIEKDPIKLDSIIYFDSFSKKKLNPYIVADNNTKIIQLCKEYINNPKVSDYEKGKAHSFIGDSYRRINDQKNALLHLTKSKKILKGKDLGVTLNRLARLYIITYSYEDALSTLIEAEKINHIENSKIELAITYGLISLIYEEEESSLRKSLVYNEKALNLFKQENDVYSIVSSLINRGTIYINLKEYSQALLIFEEAQKKSHQLQDDFLMGTITLNISETNYFLEKYPEAKQNALKSLEYFKNFPDKYYNAGNYYILGKIYLKLKEYNKAKSAINKSIEISKKFKINEFLEKNYLELATLFEIQKDYKNSLFCYKLFNEYSDSIAKMNNFEKTERIKSNFDFKNLEHQLKLKTIEVKTIENEKNTTRVKYILFILLSISLAITSLILIRNYSLKNNKLKLAKKNLQYQKEINFLIEKEKEKEIEYKSKEITHFAVNIKNKIETLSSIKNDLTLLLKKIKEPSLKNAIKSILLSIQQNIERNKMEINLHEDINSVNESFQSKLADNYPSLSQKEIKISMLLLLGFSSKEISNELNILEQSVNNYRRSIRKKLNLTKEQDLTSFLKKI